MNTPRTCRRCGATIPAGTDACPRCLLALSLEPPPADPDAPAEVVTAASGPRARPAPPAVEELAAAFPDLEIVGLIGQGGMGAVYRARQRRLEREVALKVLPRESSADRTFAERFLREARALARLSHPNIVAVHDYGESGGLCWLSMELVDGANLRQLLREGRLEPRQALGIVRELCDALQYAHDEGVVHRDIKPENVLVDRRGRVKVTDFGLAKLVGPAQEATLTGEGQVMGTLHYMAPEQIERPRDVDHRADIYALGVVLYEMLTGSLPRGKFDPPSRRVQVDVKLDEIVLKALEHEPSRRYQHAIEVKTDVDEVDAGGPPAEGAARPASAAPSAAHEHVHRLMGIDLILNAQGLRIGGGAVFLCLAMWIAAGALWNTGPVGIALASVPLPVVCGALLIRSALRSRPALAKDLARQPSAQVVLASAGAAVLGVLALLSLVMAAVSSWERGTWAWHGAFDGPLGLLETWRQDPVRLLRLAGLGGAPPARLALDVVRGTALQNPDQRLSIWPWVFAAEGALVLVLALHLAMRPSSPGPLRRDSWHLAIGIATSALGSLAVLVLVLPIAANSGKADLEGVEQCIYAPGTVDQVGPKLHAAFVAAGLQVDVEQEVALNSDRDEHVRVHVDALLCRAASASPVERWRVSFRGAKRATPQVWATAASHRQGFETAILLQAGLYPPGSREEADARALLERIEKELGARR